METKEWLIKTAFERFTGLIWNNLLRLTMLITGNWPRDQILLRADEKIHTFFSERKLTACVGKKRRTYILPMLKTELIKRLSTLLPSICIVTYVYRAKSSKFDISFACAWFWFAIKGALGFSCHIYFQAWHRTLNNQSTPRTRETQVIIDP